MPILFQLGNHIEGNKEIPKYSPFQGGDPIFEQPFRACFVDYIPVSKKYYAYVKIFNKIFYLSIKNDFYKEKMATQLMFPKKI